MKTEAERMVELGITNPREYYEACEAGLLSCEWDGCDDNDDYDGGAVM